MPRYTFTGTARAHLFCTITVDAPTADTAAREAETRIRHELTLFEFQGHEIGGGTSAVTVEIIPARTGE